MADRVTREEYEELLSDRPAKFMPGQVGFRKSNQSAKCASCVHWYRSAAGEHDTCEIMRPDDEQVPWDWICDFFNTDRTHYPLYQEKSK